MMVMRTNKTMMDRAVVIVALVASLGLLFTPWATAKLKLQILR